MMGDPRPWLILACAVALIAFIVAANAWRQRRRKVALPPAAEVVESLLTSLPPATAQPAPSHWPESGYSPTPSEAVDVLAPATWPRMTARLPGIPGPKIGKLTPEQVRMIRAPGAVERHRARDLAAAFGVHPSTIRRARRGDTWRSQT